MAKPDITVKLKRKDGEGMTETWKDGEKHDVKQASFITIFLEGAGGRPYAFIAPDVIKALKKGGLNVEDFYLNVYTEAAAPPSPRGHKVVDTDEDLFGAY